MPPFLDKDGNKRAAARIRWWDPQARTLRQIAEIPAGSTTPDHQPCPELPRTPAPEAEEFRYPSTAPVLFGHYWLTGDPAVASPVTACMDYSAVGPGESLVPYQWDGEAELAGAAFVAYSDP